MIKKTLLPIAAALLLGACAKSTSYYLLPVQPPAQEALNPLPDPHVYAMRYVNIPDYLSNRYILFFNPDGSVNRDPNRRWVDYPEDNIRRLFALHLSKRLNSEHFYTYPLPQHIRPERIVDIEVVEMIAYAEGLRFQAAADWQISEPGAMTQKYRFNREYPLTDTDGATLSWAYRRALEDLSAAIAPTLAKP